MSVHQALLITDIVDSTELAQQLGDEAMSVLWREHDRVSHDLLRRWRGREIDRSDGLLLLFDHAADGVGYAVDYHHALSRLPIPMRARAGLHVGPVTFREHEADDIALGAKRLEVDGIAKPVAARVMSLAQGGQTLLTADAQATLGATQWRVQSHGHWRLKGVAEPVELFEAGDDTSPFIPPPDADKVYRVIRTDDLWLPRREVRHSLPAERDAFIGRHGDLRELARRFDRGSRQVTLVGTGGTGKTRLAQRFGWSWLGDYPGGVWFCDLQQARDIDGIVHAVAQGLNVPLGKLDPVVHLGNVMSGRGRSLVILDNFEQVCAYAEHTAGQWLERARDVRLLVTSRSVLGIAGEEVLAVEPLEPVEASQLFVRRARAARHDYRPTAIDEASVDPLVRLLDRLPLAIELAAARVRVMPPRILLQRMSERFDLLTSKGSRQDRQATLRATFDWSWDLLSPMEKAAFAQLSVFEGGFTLSAAEAVIDLGSNAAGASTLDVVQSLVEKSLIRRRSDERFDMLMTVQEYAAEHLRTENSYTGSGSRALAAAQTRHWSYFSGSDAEAAEIDVRVDLDNLMLATRRAAHGADVRAAVSALERAWAALRSRGPFRLGVDLAQVVCQMPGLDGAALAHADGVAGWALLTSGRIAEAELRLERALGEARAAGDRAFEGHLLGLLGGLHVDGGNPERGRVESTDTLAIARELGDRLLECEALTTLGNLCEHTSEFVSARAHYEAALATSRRAGDRRWEGGCLGNLGLLYANMGKMTEAREHYEAALAITRETGERQWEGNTLCNLGLLHHVQGRMSEARVVLGDALAVARETGHVRLEAVVRCNLGIVDEALGLPEDARAQYEAALEVARRLGDRRSEGQFLGYLGLLHARQGRYVDSRACLEAGEKLLVEAADRLNLAMLLCGRAESEHLQGAVNPAREAYEAASALAREFGAEPQSELGLALARVGSIVLRDAASA